MQPISRTGDLQAKLTPYGINLFIKKHYSTIILLIILSSCFFLDTRGARNIFYILASFSLYFIYKNLSLSEAIKQNIVKIYLVYIGYFFASMLWASHFTVEQAFNVTRASLFTTYFLALGVLVTSQNQSLKWVKLILLGAATVSAIWVIGRYIYLDLWPQRLRGIGMGTNSLHGPAMFGPVIFLASSLLLAKDTHSNFTRNQIIYTLSAITFVIYVLLTQSRGPLIAFAVTTFLGLLLCRRFKILLALLGLSVIVGTGVLLGVEDWSHIGRYGAQSYRLEIWRHSFDLLQDNWFFGLGYLTRFDLPIRPDYSIHTPHSIFIGQLFYGGIVGLCLFILLIGTVIFYGYRQFQTDKDPGPLLAFSYGLISGLTNFERLITNLRPEWIFFWLPIGIIAGKEYRKAKMSVQSQT